MELVKIIRKDGVIIEVPENQVNIALRVSNGKIATEDDVIKSSAIKPPEIPKEESLICPICGYVGKNAKAIRMHKFAKHKVKE